MSERLTDEALEDLTGPHITAEMIRAGWRQ